MAGLYNSPYGPGSSANTPSQKPTEKGSIYTGTVIKVHDGDTINVRDPHGATHKVRLHAVDAPELKQSYGTTAQHWLSEQIQDQPIKIRVITKDRYQREVAQVFRPSTDCEAHTLCDTDEDVNLQLLEHGHVWWYRDYAKEQRPQDKTRYSQAEANARQQHIGLWDNAHPTPPWEWRRAQRQDKNKE